MGPGMVLEANGRDVIEGCQRGDQDSFRVLFDTHKDRVYSIALRYSGNEAVAMDIAQDTFVKLFSSIRTFRGDSSFESWLYRMVVNRCLDHQRRGRRLIPLIEDLFGAARSSDVSALEGLLSEEWHKSVQDVVATLPPEHRIVIIMRYTDGLSYDEIAQVLGCSPGTVASRLNRAHRTLERRLSHLKKAPGGCCV